jgi:5-methylcytosine-specific restriction protein A
MVRAEHKIPDSITGQHIVAAAEKLDGNIVHPFHESTKFDVLIGNRRYPPKAILGVASRIAAGVDLLPADFTGGIGSKCFRIIERLGFKIVPKWNVNSSHNFVQGRLYNRKSNIHDIFGGNLQSRIVTRDSSSFILLFSSNTEDKYGHKDGWSDSGVFLFAGEGQKGDQTFSRGNKAIRDHVREGRTLELFESSVKANDYRYIGSFMCDSWETQRGTDVNGEGREMILFHLVPIASERADLTELTNLPTSLDELRRQALDASNTVALPRKQVMQNAYYRSQVVKNYVLMRANGKCEACGSIAPFQRKDGSPYLEPHHTRRLSDEGPDHPRWVGAVCPNCHREIHSGLNGDDKNQQLIDYLGSMEPEA